MSVGLGLLRLAPAHFWAMTPREFAIAAGIAFSRQHTAPSRDEFGRMMDAFPDRPRQEE